VKKLFVSILLLLCVYNAFGQSEWDGKEDEAGEAVLQKETERIDLLNQRFSEKTELEKQYTSAVKKIPVLWTLAGIDILAGGTAAITVILGKTITDRYYASANTSEALTLKNQSVTCSNLFTASLLTAGLLTSAVLVIAILPPQKKTIEKQLASEKLKY